MAKNYSSYIPMSSSTNKQAANYRLPASSTSTQKNAVGNTIYANTGPSGQVLGAASDKQNGGWYNGVQYWAPGQGPSNDGGGGGQSGPSEPDWSSMISEMYEPYKRELEAMEGTINSEYAGDEKILNDQYALNERMANDQQTELLGAADREEGKFNNVLSSAYEEAIRDYNALQQQARVRFGRGNSAGQAVGELAQREFFREQGKINNKKAEGAQEFGLERTRIAKYVKDKLDQLRINRDTAMNELKKNLSDRLADIRSRKYDIEANKTRDRMAILQDTINQARAMKQADQTFRQNLGMAAISKMQEIQGRTFTPKEIQAVMAEFGINLNVGAGPVQQGGTMAVRRPGQRDDELSVLQGGGFIG